MPPTTRPGVPYEAVLEALPEASPTLFAADPHVRAVGATAAPGGAFALGVIRNPRGVVPRIASVDADALAAFADIPIVVRDAPGDPTSLARIPVPPRDAPRAPTRVPERRRHRPLACGLEVQNFDADVRGKILPDRITVGTLGGFATLLADDRPAFLSNNHVLAAENRGRKLRDRIVQAAGDEYDEADWCAILQDFVPLKKSSRRAHPSRGNVVWNLVDAAVAALRDELHWKPRYLPGRRGARRPQGLTEVELHDRVFKVGRTTGYTSGKVTLTAVQVGPVGYDLGPCWFEQSFVVEGLRGRDFSDGGDSGSLIVKRTGEVVGLLYAGDGTHTYACPIAPALEVLGCALATSG